MRDMVQVHVSVELPIRARALPYADRLEIRLGKAYPVVLLVDKTALPRFERALAQAKGQLEASEERRSSK